MDDLKIALLVLARPTFDIALAEQVALAVRSQLLSVGFDPVGPDTLIMDLKGAQAAARSVAAEAPDLLLVLQATFADSTMIAALTEHIDAPILLWAVPEAASGSRLRLNSLCGVNLAAHALTLRGRRYAHVYASPKDDRALEQVRITARAGRVRRKLRQTRLGLIGQHPAGMDTCHFDADELKNRLGVTIQQYPLQTLFAEMPSISKPQIESVRASLYQQLPNLASLDQTALEGTIRAYQAMHDLSNGDDLQGLAVRCWPEFFESMNCSACGAASLLNDAHIPMACEADVNGTITLLILQWLSGEPAFDADLVSVDAENDSAVIWHCGKAPLSMADPAFQPVGGIHSNRRVPLVMEFSLKPGSVTVARLSRADGRLRLVIGRGMMLSSPPGFSGTSGLIRFERPVVEVLHTILEEGLEHHIAVTYGDHVAPLLALARMLEMPVLRL